MKIKSQEGIGVAVGMKNALQHSGAMHRIVGCRLPSLTFIKHDAIQHTAVGQFTSWDLLDTYVPLHIYLSVVPPLGNNLFDSCDSLKIGGWAMERMREGRER